MARVKRKPHTRPANKERKKRRFQHPPAKETALYQKRFEGSVLAAQIIEAMIDNISAAIRCIKRELSGIFWVDCDLVPIKGRIHIYLKTYDRLRKHAHLVVATGETNKLVSVTHYGRTWI